MIFKKQFLLFSFLSFFLSNVSFAGRTVNADLIHSNTSTGSICVPPAVTLDCNEVGYLDGITSSVQTQIDGKEPTIGRSPFTLIWADGTSVLGSLPNWGVNADHFGLFNNLSYSSIDGQNTNFEDDTLNSGMGIDAPTSNVTGYAETLNHDNAASAFSFGNVYLRRMELRLNGNGPTNYSANISLRHLLGNGSTTGTLNDGNGIDNYMNIGAGFSLLGTYNLQSNSSTIDGFVENIYANNNYINGSGTAQYATGFNLAIQVPVIHNVQLASFSNNATIGGDLTGLGMYSDSVIAGNSSMVNMNQTQNVGGNLNFFNAFVSSPVTVAGDFRQLQLGNDGAVTNNAAGSLITQNGAVAKSYTGYGSYVGADIGDGTSNLIHFDSGSNHTPARTVSGQIFGFNFSNNSIVTGTNNINGLNVSNQGDGYRFSGASIYNQANMSEEAIGFRFNNQGNFRTGAGVDVNMQGAATDDVRGLRVNVTNQTSSSTTNHVQSAEFQGGTFSVQSSSVPFNNVAVDIGNGFSHQIEIANGSPTVGTDVIQTLIQNNLLLHDTIGAGPFGLDINGVGIVNQIAFDSGIVQSVYRNVLMGTTVPQGSGGTVDTWIDLELLGLPSFGGSITNNYRIGIQDSQLVGQNWCDNVSIDCWFMRVRDQRAENLFGRIAINTVNQKVSPGVRLEIHDGHVKSSQTTAPVPTVDANAGTGATCTLVSGNDKRGKISITTGTIGVSTGSYCALAFNAAYNVSPTCMLTPASSTLSTSVYAIETTTELDLGFAVAGGIASTYVLNYDCEEAQ